MSTHSNGIYCQTQKHKVSHIQTFASAHGRTSIVIFTAEMTLIQNETFFLDWIRTLICKIYAKWRTALRLTQIGASPPCSTFLFHAVKTFSNLLTTSTISSNVFGRLNNYWWVFTFDSILVVTFSITSTTVSWSISIYSRFIPRHSVEFSGQFYCSTSLIPWTIFEFLNIFFTKRWNFNWYLSNFAIIQSKLIGKLSVYVVTLSHPWFIYFWNEFMYCLENIKAPLDVHLVKISQFRRNRQAGDKRELSSITLTLSSPHVRKYPHGCVK